MTLEELHKEYSRIVEAINKGELSNVNGQGALAYLELKAKDAGIIFVAPELNHRGPNYIPLDETIQQVADNLFRHSDDPSDEYADSSEVQDDLSDVVAPTPPETDTETDSDSNSKFEQ